MNRRRKHYIIIFAASLILLSMLVIWLNNHFFFLWINNSDFNNLLTPVTSLVSVILLVLTLSDSQEYNSNQLALNEYTILMQDFKLLKSNLNTLQFRSGRDAVDSIEVQMLNSNGINNINLLSTFLNRSNTEEQIEQFRNTVIFPLTRNYNDLHRFLVEIISNEILVERYKRKLYAKIEQQLLQDYLRVCNDRLFGGQISYDMNIFNSFGYNASDFYRINNLFIQNNLFQINDLNFYETAH